MGKKDKSADLIADLLKAIGGAGAFDLGEALRKSANEATKEMADKDEKDDCDCPACSLRRLVVGKAAEAAKADDPDVQVKIRSFSSAEEAQEFIGKLMRGEVPEEPKTETDSAEVDVHILDTIEGVGGVSKLSIGIAKDKGLLALKIHHGENDEGEAVFFDKKLMKKFAISMIAATATLGA